MKNQDQIKQYLQLACDYGNKEVKQVASYWINYVDNLHDVYAVKYYQEENDDQQLSELCSPVHPQASLVIVHRDFDEMCSDQQC
ncbi:hypothetical protein ELBI_47 [Anabaena phage Elbi]|nr:hypothetical protein ELBI_47 [Anabaena phage Elbi]